MVTSMETENRYLEELFLRSDPGLAFPSSMLSEDKCTQIERVSAFLKIGMIKIFSQKVCRGWKIISFHFLSNYKDLMVREGYMRFVT